MRKATKFEYAEVVAAAWARIGELVGQKDLAVTANTYTHVMAEGELNYAGLLEESA
jgi:hypothetical protein